MASFFGLLLVLGASNVVLSTEYSPTFENRDKGDNSVTITCQRAVTGQDIANSDWYFNGSLYSEHPCTENAVVESAKISFSLTAECEGYIQCREQNMDSVSLPLLFQAFPVFSMEEKNYFINVTGGDRVVIPCGIPVSATDNFVIKWSETYGQTTNSAIENPIIQSDYSLVIPSHRAADTEYSCQATATIGTTEDAEVGIKTYVRVFPYTPPQINDIQLTQDNDGVVFELSVEGIPSITYTWKWNGDKLDNEDDNITIQPSSSTATLRRSSVKDGDWLSVEVQNTQIQSGETVSDAIRAFVVVSTATPTLTTQISSSPSNTNLPTAPCGLESSQQNPVYIVLIVIAVLIFLVAAISVLVILFLCSRNKNDLPCYRSKKNVLTVKCPDGSNAFYNVDKMNNFDKFLTDINHIVSTFAKAVTDRDEIDPEIKTKIREVAKIMINWEDKDTERAPCNETVGDFSKGDEPCITILNDDSSESQTFKNLLPVLSQLNE